MENRETPATPGAVTAAVRAAAEFDRTAVSAAAGLLAAIPVVVVLGVGLALGNPVAGVTMGAGAMLVGIAWRTAGGRPPLAVMTIDALVMAASTFVGCVTGSVTWVHLIVLCVWSFMGGMLVGVGNRGGVIGTQAIIAVVVFGRFSEPAPAALGLAGFVLVGGLAQVLLQSIVRWPLPLRAQRTATAAAYRELAKVALATDDPSALAPAAALDDAAKSLASPALFGDAALMTLRSLVSEAYRSRIQLIGLHALLRQQHPLAPGQRRSQPDADDRPVATGALEAPATIDSLGRWSLHLTASALELAAQAIEGRDDAENELGRIVAELTAAIEQHEAASGDGPSQPAGPAERQLIRRLSALSGQLRAVSSLAPGAVTGGGLWSRRPVRRTDRPLDRARDHLAELRANISLRSPAGRHAVRLAVIVPVTALIARELPLSRSYWMVVAAATVLRPEFGATFTRGTERALGTTLGVGLAGAIAVLLHPTGAVTVAMVGLLAWAGYATFPASFATGFAFITALVVFLLNAVSPDTLATASARLLDTLVGGTIGLAAYALWPTWSRMPAWQSLADLVAAERTYLDGVLTALIDGHRAREQQMTGLSRRARLTRTNAEATVARSLSEPATRRIDASRSQAVLGAMRRLIQAAHVLRLDAQEQRGRRPMPELTPLKEGVDALLTSVESTLRVRPQDSPSPTPLPDLRERYGGVQRAVRAEDQAAELLAELDEMVDAANGVASAAGLESVDTDGTPDEDPSTGHERAAVRLNLTMTTFPDSHRDLLDAQVATLGTIDGHGFPQLTEVWFLYEDGEVRISLNDSRLKTRHLMKRPHCSLLVLDLANPYRYLEIRGTARIEPDDDYAFAQRVGAKYGGADLREHDRPGERRVTVTIEPTNVYAVNMSSG
jgi:PPOX class probable F420-dependent enzyme